MNNEEKETEKKDFIFHITNEVTYTTYDDFNSSEARSLMEKRMKTDEFLGKISKQLSELRTQFHKSKLGDRPKLSTEILTLERTIEKNTETLRELDNEIRSIEIQTLRKR